MHLILGYSTDHINSYLLNLSLKGIQRLNSHCVKRAEPITLDILFQFHEILDFSVNENIVYWCLFLFAFFLAARKSNLVPGSSKDIFKGKYLNSNHVHYYGNVILVHFNWSKTIQFGERQLIVPLLRLKDKRICPVLISLNIKCFKDMLFSLPRHSYITYNLFQKKLRECISLIGLNPKLFSSHSFRRGFATLAFKSDIPPEHIQLLGDWKSDAYKVYLELDWHDKVKILNKMFVTFEN